MEGNKRRQFNSMQSVSADDEASMPSKKRVRISDNLSTTCQIEGLAGIPSVRRRVWYQNDEIQSMKQEALATCAEARRVGFDIILNSSYGIPGDGPQFALNEWSRDCSGRRGLERFINQDLAIRRKETRKNTVHSVVLAQEDLKREKGINTANVLGRLSRTLSKDSIDFAIRMGLADFQAVRDFRVQDCSKETSQGKPRGDPSGTSSHRRTARPVLELSVKDRHVRRESW